MPQAERRKPAGAARPEGLRPAATYGETRSSVWTDRPGLQCLHLHLLKVDQTMIIDLGPDEEIARQAATVLGPRLPRSGSEIKNGP